MVGNTKHFLSKPSSFSSLIFVVNSSYNFSIPHDGAPTTVIDLLHFPSVSTTFFRFVLITAKPKYLIVRPLSS